jgi:hypothetical protein
MTVDEGVVGRDILSRLQPIKDATGQGHGNNQQDGNEYGWPFVSWTLGLPFLLRGFFGRDRLLPFALRTRIAVPAWMGLLRPVSNCSWSRAGALTHTGPMQYRSAILLERRKVRPLSDLLAKWEVLGRSETTVVEHDPTR